MAPATDDIPGLTDDPVMLLILDGTTRTIDEAEEYYLDHSLPELLDLLRGPATDEELENHPLIRLLVVRGSRGWEDSLL